MLACMKMRWARSACALIAAASAVAVAPPVHAASVPQLAYVAGQQLFVVSADGSGKREVPASSPNGISASAWLKDGRVLYDKLDGWSSEVLRERWELRVANTSNGRDAAIRKFDFCCRPVSLVQPAGQWLGRPVWSPGGRRAAFTTTSCVNTFVWGLG